MELKFEKLIIWQKTMDLGELINNIARKFPKDEIYNLSSQIRRAADSISLNISEGPQDKPIQNLRNSWVMLFVH